MGAARAAEFLKSLAGGAGAKSARRGSGWRPVDIRSRGVGSGEVSPGDDLFPCLRIKLKAGSSDSSSKGINSGRLACKIPSILPSFIGSRKPMRHTHGFLSSLALTAIAIFPVGFVHGAEGENEGSDRPVSYWNDIRPLMQASCQGCHQPAKAKGDYVLTDVKRLIEGGESDEAAVLPGKPDESPSLGAPVRNLDLMGVRRRLLCPAGGVFGPRWTAALPSESRGSRGLWAARPAGSVRGHQTTRDPQRAQP